MEEWRSLDVQRGRGGEFVGRVERVERVDFNAEAQRRSVRRGDGRVERVAGESVSQGAPSLRDVAKKGECSHQ